jgi:hypothetical protein
MNINLYENKSGHYEHIYFIIKLDENKPGHYKHIYFIVRCCIYLTTYDWIKSFLKITIERRAIYGNLENKINTLYLARRKFHS